MAINGKVYINKPGSVFDCYDLRTGSLLYEKPGTISRGLQLNAPTITGQGEVFVTEAHLLQRHTCGN